MGYSLRTDDDMSHITTLLHFIPCFPFVLSSHTIHTLNASVLWQRLQAQITIHKICRSQTRMRTAAPEGAFFQPLSLSEYILSRTHSLHTHCFSPSARDKKPWPQAQAKPEAKPQFMALGLAWGFRKAKGHPRPRPNAGAFRAKPGHAQPNFCWLYNAKLRY